MLYVVVRSLEEKVKLNQLALRRRFLQTIIRWLTNTSYNMKKISHVIHNLFHVHLTLSVTDSLLFINLPYSVSRSCDESESKSERNWKDTVRVSPAKQVEVKEKCKLNFVLFSNAAQTSWTKTILLKCVINFFAISIFCQHTNGKVQ